MAQSQDNLGIAGSSRAPVNTVLINPSSIVDSRAFIDFNLVGASMFVRNNFVFIPGDQFSISGISDIKEPSFERKNAPYKAYGDIHLHGPSLVFNVKSHAFGLYSGVRVVSDVRGIPESLGYFITEGFQYQQQMGQRYTIRDLRAHGLGWMEFGGTYATIIDRKANQLTQVGISVKRLMGIAGVGLRLDEWNYAVVDSNNIETYSFRGEYGFNEPALNSGGGFGFDLGVTFKKTDRNVQGYQPFSPCTKGDYKYKLGFSILDIGSVKFKGPFYRNVFNETEQSEWNDFSGTKAEDAAQLDSLFNEGFDLSKQNSSEESFRMKLPTAFSAQIDYNVGYNFYVFGIATLGFPRRNHLGVQRASYIGVVPRYEIKRFEISIPMSLYEMQAPQIGLMLRLNSIIIGTDMLGPLLFNQDVYGADFYFNLKYTMFRHWKCHEKKSKGPRVRGGGGKTIPCPSW